MKIVIVLLLILGGLVAAEDKILRYAADKPFPVRVNPKGGYNLDHDIFLPSEQEQHPCVLQDGKIVYVGKYPDKELCYTFRDVDGSWRVTTGEQWISAAEWTENRDGQFVERSSSVVRKFKEFTGFTNGRKGYVIDHIIPLCAGGRDSIENMQWQEEALSYRKDVFERALCRALVAQKMRVQ